jgi:4-hydroxybenzoate polyprenyltransferase
MLSTLAAAVRIVHPAPALAVTALSSGLAAILAAETADPNWAAVWLVTLSVAGSQVFTGATNDLNDQARDAILRPEKPLPSGRLGASTALWIAAGGLAVQVATSARLGTTPLILGGIATASARVYSLWLSRTPLSVVPYLVSFGVLPLFVAAGVGVPVERVLPAVILVAPFAAAAHLANTVRDFEADAELGSRCLAQVLGRQRAHRVAFLLAAGVGLAAGVVLFGSSEVSLPAAVLGLAGMAAVLAGWNDSDRLWRGMLVAAVAWTLAWGLASA